MNQSETAKLLAVLKAQYQHKFVTDAMTAGVWMELLNAQPAIPYAAAHNAAITWMQHNDWPPSVKDLRDLIAEKVCGLPNADDAWVQLTAWLKAGYPGMPDRRPPLPSLIADAVRQIGGTSMVRNGDATREQFAKAYDRLRRERMQVTNVTEAWAALESGTPPTMTALPSRKVSA